MKTITCELNFRALFFVLAFGLVGCNKEEFYEKEFLENPFAPEMEVPETDGGFDGGSTVGGSTVGGTTDGGSTVGGSTVGGTTDGGSTVGGTTVGGNTDGGSTVGGTTVGGSTVGGTTDGGSTVGGTTVGGSTVGGTTDGGSTVGGTTVGGSTTGGSTTGSTDGGTTAGGTVGGGQPVSDWTDSFTQVADSDKKVDIAWVVDNSGSMGDDQTSLANNFDSFIRNFITRGIDFKMGITTTDCSTEAKCGAAVPGSLESLTAVQANGNPQAFISTFKAHIKVGTNGSSRERGLFAAEKFLDRYAQEHYRSDSRLVLVFVSDEEDQSPQSTQYYLNRYLAEKANMGQDYVRAYSIVKTGCQSSGCQFARYAYQSNNTGGSVLNIDGNFANTLADIGADIQSLIDSFSLSHTPVAGSLEVKVNGVVVTEWTLDGRNLKFNQGHVPSVGANIQVKYQY